MVSGTKSVLCVYLDDTLVFSIDFDGHLEIEKAHTVLRRLRSHDVCSLSLLSYLDKTHR